MSKTFQLCNTNYVIETFLKSLGYRAYEDSPYTKPDFVVTPGGSDVNPNLYFEKKEPGTHVNNQADYEEVCGIMGARLLGIPQIGICKGFQLLHVLSGGTLEQEVSGHNRGNHKVFIAPGKPLLEVTSTHHQCVPAEETRGYEEVYYSEDGVTEAIVTKSRNWGGVQFHPEYTGASQESKDFFHGIVKKLTEKGSA